MYKYIDIVFDGPPSPNSGRFVEIEDETGSSIDYGKWVHRRDGFWVLRIPASDHSRISSLEGSYKNIRESQDALLELQKALLQLVKVHTHV